MYSCLAPGDDEESGEAKEEQVRQEFEALGGEMKQRNQGFLNKMLLLLWREVVTSDSDVILDIDKDKDTHLTGHSSGSLNALQFFLRTPNCTLRSLCCSMI